MQVLCRSGSLPAAGHRSVSTGMEMQRNEKTSTRVNLERQGRSAPTGHRTTRGAVVVMMHGASARRVAAVVPRVVVPPGRVEAAAEEGQEHVGDQVRHECTRVSCEIQSK